MDQTKKNKIIGLIIILGSLICFFTLSSYFNLFEVKIEYRNPSFVLKMFLADIFIPLGLYLSLYFINGKKLALQIGGGMALLLIIGYILGLLLH